MRHLEYALDTFAPEVLIGQQMTLGSMLVGEHHQIPLAIMGLASYIWPLDEMPDYYSPDYWDLLLDRYREIFDLYEACRTLFPSSTPVSRLPYNESPILGDLFLLQSVPELEGDALSPQSRPVCWCL